MAKRDKKIRPFFEKCLHDWALSHGREPLTREEMWDAVIDGMENRKGKRPN